MEQFRHMFLGALIVALVIGTVAAVSFFERTGAQQAALDVVFDVKAVVPNVGTNDASKAYGQFPTTVVIPLPESAYQNTSQFKLEDNSGNQVPAQFDALTRWWNSDSSIRHLKVEFQPSVAAWSPTAAPFTTGIAKYHLKDCKGSCIPASGPKVTVTDTGSTYLVNTGPFQFSVKKTAGFNIIDEAWFEKNGAPGFQSDEQVISSSSSNGAKVLDQFKFLQSDSARTDVTVALEESGPTRAVILATAPTLYYSTSKTHYHGFSVRIYAYAGKPFVKVDYALENGALNPPDSGKPLYWPFYFENAALQFSPNVGANPNVTFGFLDGSNFSAKVGNNTPYLIGLYAAIDRHDQEKLYDFQNTATPIKSLTLSSAQLGADVRTSWVDVTGANGLGLTAARTKAWQTWPNGYSVDGAGKIGIDIFPFWGAEPDQLNSPSYMSKSGLYWVPDAGLSYNETWLYFHGANQNPTDLQDFIKTANEPPVGVVPVPWMSQTKAMFDMGGEVGATVQPTQDLRLPDYFSSWELKGSDNISSAGYLFGKVNFREDDEVHQVPCNYGGWPYVGNEFLVSGNPTDRAEIVERGIYGALNRNILIRGYNDLNDYPFQKLDVSGNGKCGLNPREFISNSALHFDAPVLPNTKSNNWGVTGIGNTGDDWLPGMWDDAHGWGWYKIHKAYILTGNPFLRDVMNFWTEMRWGRLLNGGRDPFIDNNNRAIDHSIMSAELAAEITGGQTSRGPIFGDAAKGQIGIQDYIRKVLLPGGSLGQEPYWGYVQKKGPERTEFIAYGVKTLREYMKEIENSNPQAWAEAFNLVGGYINYIANPSAGNFCYNCSTSGNQLSKTGISVAADAIGEWHLMTGDNQSMAWLDAAIQWQICTNTGNAAGSLYSDNDLPAWWPYYKSGSTCVSTTPAYAGDYYGRSYLLAKFGLKPDKQSPSPVADLAATVSGSDVVLRWTAPKEADATKRYHVVWSAQPITGQTTTNKATTNWWAANAIGPSFKPVPGTIQSLTVKNVAPPFYAAVFTFDTSNNMSPISNVAYASLTGNDGQFVLQNVPATMIAGNSYPITMTMKNTGTTNWTQTGGYLLGDPSLQWGNWVSLSPGETIAPNQSKTFSWIITAPSSAGTYNFQWQMIQMNVEWFGAASQPVSVVVSAKGAGSTSGSGGGAGKVEKPGGTAAVEIKRVGPDLGTASAPSGTSAYIVDAELVSSSNPAIFKQLVSGAHTAGATDVSGFDELAGTCAYASGSKACLVSSFTIVPSCDGNLCTIPVTAPAGQTLKAAFKYTPTPSVDNPPTVALTSPANGATVPAGNIVFTFSATDKEGLIGAALYFDVGNGMQPYTNYQAKLSGTKASGSITLPNIPSGIGFKWLIQACDNKGQCANSATYSVATKGGTIPPPASGKIEPPVDALPQVTLISPANGATIPAGAVTFTFSATDDDTSSLVGASLFVTAGGKTLPYNVNQPKLSGKQATASISVPNVPTGLTFQWNVLVAGTGPKGLQYSYAPLNFTATTKSGIPGSGADKKTPPPPPQQPGAGGKIEAPPLGAPQAPYDLFAQTVYGEKPAINLVWKDNSNNEQGFNIERSTDGFSFSLAGKASAGSTGYSDTRASTNHNYWYRVKAFNAIGESAPSNIGAAAMISLPSNLSLVVVSPSQINVNWVDKTDIESAYVVERSTTGASSGFSVIAGNLPVNTSSLSDSGLTPNTSYWYRVKAVNRIGESPYSTVVSGTTPPAGASGSSPISSVILPPPVPASPTGLQAQFIDGEKPGVNLTWQDSSKNEDGFKIERSFDGINFAFLDVVGRDVVSYRDAKIVKEQPNHFYRIRAFNSAGDAAPSNIAGAAVR